MLAYLERSENDGFVLDVVDDQALAGLYEPRADVFDVGHGDHEPILACAGPLYFAK